MSFQITARHAFSCYIFSCSFIFGRVRNRYKFIFTFWLMRCVIVYSRPMTDDSLIHCLLCIASIGIHRPTSLNISWVNSDDADVTNDGQLFHAFAATGKKRRNEIIWNATACLIINKINNYCIGLYGLYKVNMDSTEITVLNGQNRFSGLCKNIIIGFFLYNAIYRSLR